MQADGEENKEERFRLIAEAHVLVVFEEGADDKDVADDAGDKDGEEAAGDFYPPPHFFRSYSFTYQPEKGKDVNKEFG